MGRPYSLDLRERVVAAVHGGMSCEEAAEHYEVSQSSAIHWVRRDRETGSPAALPMGGKKPPSRPPGELRRGDEERQATGLLARLRAAVWGK